MNIHFRNLLVIAVAFAAVVGGLLIRANTGYGVDGNTYMLFAAGWLLAGLLVLAGYLLWWFARNRVPVASIIAGVVMGAAALAIGIWFLLEYRADALCQDGHNFYKNLAAAKNSERSAMIAGGGIFVSAPPSCGRGTLRSFFKRDGAKLEATGAPLLEAERIEVLAQLFAAGLPPSDEMLRDAMNDGDLAGLRVVLAARKRIGVTTFRAYITEIAASKSRCQGNSSSIGQSGKLTAYAKRFREGLNILFAAATPPDPANYPERTRKSLSCLGLIRK